MSNYDSPLGSKSGPDKEFRVLEVPDESGYAPLPQDTPTPSKPELEAPPTPSKPSNESFNDQMERIKDQEVAQAKRREAIEGKEKLSNGALDRISILLGLTRLYRKVTLGDDITFILRSIKSNEYKNVIIATSQSAEISSIFEIRRQYLAYSLDQISGRNINEFIGSNDFEAKLAFVDQLDDGVAARLYDEYLLLRDEVQSKYGLKNDDDAKEIVDNLKK